MVEYYVVCSMSEEGISAQQLSRIFRHPLPGTAAGGDTLEAQMEALERRLVEEALDEEKSLRQAARRLGVDASTLSRKAKKYGIELR